MNAIHDSLPDEREARKREVPIPFLQKLQYMVLFFAAYVLAAGLGHGLAIIPGVAISFWPPAGIFVGTLLTTPRRSWPWWIATGCAAELTCNAIWFDNPFHHAAIYYVANLLEALTAAWVIRALVKKSFRLEAIEEVVALVLGACVAPIVGATLIASFDALLNKHTFGTAWQLVWLGDASGLLISTPLTVVIISAWRGRARIQFVRAVEAILLVSTLFAVGWLAIGGYLPTTYMVLPPLLWTAVRFQMPGAAAALGLITLLIAGSTMRGHGEFVGQPELQHEKILMLQTFLAVSAVSALLVAALSLQRQRAIVNLQEANADLEASVALRTASLRESEERLRLLGDNLPKSVLYQYVHDRDGNSKFLYVSAGIEQLNGVKVDDVLRDAKTLFRQFPTEYLKTLSDAEHRSRTELTNFDLEVPMRRTDGELRWMSFHSQPRRLPDGSTIWEGVQIDVTDRKNRELNLAFLASISRRLITGYQSEVQILREVFDEVAKTLDLEFYFSFLSESPQSLTLVASKGLTEYQQSHYSTVHEGQLPCTAVAGQRERVVIEGLQSSQRNDVADLRELDVSCYAGFPLCTREAVMGTVGFACRHRQRFETDELQLIQTVCDQVAITLERARAERYVRESDERFRALFDSIDEGFCIIELIFDEDQRPVDYRFEEINPAMERLTGLQNALGKTARELVPDLEDYWFETYGSVVRTGDAVRFENYSAPMNRWFDVYASRVGDVDSRRVALVFNNITERKKAALEIQLGAERLRNAAEAAGFVMMYADLTTGQVTYSQELSQLIGEQNDGGSYDWNGPPPPWVHPEDRESVSRFFFELGNVFDGKSRSIDHRILHVDGTECWIRLQAKTLHATHGDHHQATQVIGTLLDITSQRVFEQSLQAALGAAEAASQAKSAFLANMSHEIRTPMTAILGYADLVAEQIPDGENAQHLRTIKRNGAFLLEIINDILDLSKIESGKFVVHRHRFAPDRLIEDVRSIMEVRAKDNNVELSVEYESAIPIEIESDPKSLKQILINLVGNAIKFTRQGSVRVIAKHLMRSGEYLLNIDIVDTGIGMSAEQMSRMFEPFSQADASVTRNFGGTGLGLAISDRLAKSLGGSISVASELGKGSTFSLTVAIGKLDGVSMIEPKSTIEGPLRVEDRRDIQLSGRILIVDDRREIRFLTRRFLTGAGATVTEAEDGEQAIALVLQGMSDATEVELILLDMQMPKLDGYQTAARLRKLGFHRPIIALTADAMQGDMSRCIESGCNDYLSKPIDKHRLLDVVQQYLCGHSND